MITPKQLKQTNLIFLEHRKLLKEVDLLGKQIIDLETINHNLALTDSLRISQLNRCMLQAELNDQVISSLSLQISKKERKVKRLKKFTIGGFTVAAGLLTILLIK